MSYPMNRVYKVVPISINIALDKYMQGITVYLLRDNGDSEIVMNFQSAIEHVKNGGKIGYFEPYDYIYILTREDVECVLADTNREHILNKPALFNNLMEWMYYNFQIYNWMKTVEDHIAIWEENNE